MNLTEKFIERVYKSIEIKHPGELSIESVSEKVDIQVNFWEFSSEIVEYKGIYKMFIDENKDSRGQWQDFGHEMCHFSWHRGDQKHLNEMYEDYQEVKADYFMYHFCAPTFMLMKYKVNSARDIMTLFNVDEEFAARRLEMYESKLISKNMTFVI